MKYTYLFILILMLPFAVLSQTTPPSDVTKQAIIDEDCHGKTFVKTEELPHLKVEKEVYADSLSTYLKLHKVKIKNQSITFCYKHIVPLGLFDKSQRDYMFIEVWQLK